MALTNKQKAEMALVRTSHTIPTGSNAEREMVLTRAALLMASTMIERVISDGMMWAGEFSVVEYFTTEIRTILEAQEQKERLEADRRYLAYTYGFTWDDVMQRYCDGYIYQPKEYIQRLLEKRNKKEEDTDMGASNLRSDTLQLGNSIPTGQLFQFHVTDQFGRSLDVAECEIAFPFTGLQRDPSYQLSVKVTTFSSDPITRSAEEALLRWLTGPSDNNHTFVKKALATPLHYTIFLIYDNAKGRHTAIGVNEMNVTGLPIRLFGIQQESLASFSSLASITHFLGEDIEVRWIVGER